MPLNSRAKGKAAELEFASFCRDHGFDETRRGVQYCGRNGNADVVGLPGIWSEVKRSETLRLHDALAQAAADAKPGDTPVVFHRRSRGKWIAILPAGAFLELLHMAEFGHAPGEIIATRTPLTDAAS
jgi:hypothetical protein